jgi:hypothetical protein
LEFGVSTFNNGYIQLKTARGEVGTQPDYVTIFCCNHDLPQLENAR